MSTFRINDNGVDRDMTEAETIEHQKAVANAQKADDQRQSAWAANEAAKASARAKLKALGLTDDEIAALVG